MISWEYSSTPSTARWRRIIMFVMGEFCSGKKYQNIQNFKINTVWNFYSWTHTYPEVPSHQQNNLEESSCYMELIIFILNHSPFMSCDERRQKTWKTYEEVVLHKKCMKTIPFKPPWWGEIRPLLNRIQRFFERVSSYIFWKYWSTKW